METILIHTFSKQEVDDLDFTRFDAIFSHWPQLWALELRGKLNCLALMVDGFDQHPDEVYVIPEVRRFYRELHKRWPWWCYFLNIESQSLQMAYLCLLDSIASVKQDGKIECAASFDTSEMAPLLEADLGRMSWLWEHSGMPEQEHYLRCQRILKLFSGDKQT